MKLFLALTVSVLCALSTAIPFAYNDDAPSDVSINVERRQSRYPGVQLFWSFTTNPAGKIVAKMSIWMGLRVATSLLPQLAYPLVGGTSFETLAAKFTEAIEMDWFTYPGAAGEVFAEPSTSFWPIWLAHTAGDEFSTGSIGVQIYAECPDEATLTTILTNIINYIGEGTETIRIIEVAEDAWGVIHPQVHSKRDAFLCSGTGAVDLRPWIDFSDVPDDPAYWRAPCGKA
ncbi:hypothetical protein LTR56_019308 [Elasticomyces elasticus]|nr:hypothetical protein LTR56_019308 [Elasticomyces elasticus]KAK3635321.1 hypothetical protein LTR22_019249 [Elasticomyces elasticus]KAK5749484.1 hypothetical protein LTS12_020477 [Elasticomyces elasticus]